MKKSTKTVLPSLNVEKLKELVGAFPRTGAGGDFGPGGCVTTGQCGTVCSNTLTCGSN
jgi:hypothetical protein